MGTIIDSVIMQEKFKKLRNQDYFVDKSNIINEFNNIINQDGYKNVCITKPRRFGKTSIAALLVTYYSKGIDSQEIFDKYKISKGIDPQELFGEFKEKIIKKAKNEGKDEKEIEIEIKEQVKKEIEKEIELYKEYQGKYHTLYFNFSYRGKRYKNINDYLTFINKNLKKDIEKVYPKSKILNDYDSEIEVNLMNLYRETREQFVIIIDEWDYIISNELYTYEERDEYIAFLKDLIKDQPYVAFTYMTGILPIAKESSQSTINCFDKYTMLNDEEYYKYFGFTEQEVRELCNNKEKKYKTLENWYNGYKAFNGDKIFNPWSVTHALYEKKIKNYWTETGRYDEIIDIINFNIIGVKDEILDLIKGKEVLIELENFGAEDLQKKSKKRRRT